jgi:hypothetical protein
MSNLTLNVLRAEDLLALRFELVNLILDPNESRVRRRLIRASPADEALMIVHFPPQHISEECFEESGRRVQKLCHQVRLASGRECVFDESAEEVAAIYGRIEGGSCSRD